MKNDPYYRVFDVSGKEVLDSAGCGTEVFYDSILKREINYEFVNHKLINAFYSDSARRIYQLCKKNASLFISILRFDLNKIDYPVNSVKENIHGFTLLRCVVEPTGFASKIDIIKGMNSECDSVITNLISQMKLKKMWYPAKVNKEEVAQEFIIPIEFSLQGISVYRYNNNWMMNRWMMNQMMYQPRLPVQGRF